MEKKNTVIVKVSYLVELTDQQLSDEVLDRAVRVLDNDVETSVEEQEVLFKWNSLSYGVLNPQEMNCGKCTNCDTWVTDREKDNPIIGLCNGATVEGKLLCDECLPPEHRWAF